MHLSVCEVFLLSANPNIGLTGILNIENRTENWKTSQFFSPLSKEKQLEFVEPLTLRTKKPLQTNSGSKAAPVRMELFWKGVRDYRHSLIKGKVEQEHAKGQRKREIAKEVDECLASRFWERYKRCFKNLGCQVSKHKGFWPLVTPNYSISEDFRDEKNRDIKELLYNNLRNTEMDIVFETDDHLLIGEAKYESAFGTNGKLVLVHQLIRQFVTASLLIKVQEEREKVVVPFLIVDDEKWAKDTDQVDFMLCQKWLFEDNIRTWKDLCAQLYG